MDILIFPAIGRRSPVACPESQRGTARLLLGCPFSQVDGLTGPDGGRESKGQRMVRWVGIIGMTDRRSGPVRRQHAAKAFAGE
jgi:hypothetical protein